MLDVDRRLVRRTFSLSVAAVAIAIVAVGCTTGTEGSGTSSASASTAVAAPSATATSIPSSPTTSPEDTAMTTPTPSATPKLALSSPAFEEGQPIPRKYSCHGADVSPALAWQGVPSNAAALVLFVDDPDGRDWVHWTVLDLPAKDGGLSEGVDPQADPPQQGKNDFGKVGYGGPCPPSGTHHYRFKLYALAAPLGLSGHPDGAAVRRALGNATVVAHVTLTGTFRA
jgi:Raf kinase inhibitor-like YbhB/YbcL family protein